MDVRGAERVARQPKKKKGGTGELPREKMPWEVEMTSGQEDSSAKPWEDSDIEGGPWGWKLDIGGEF